MMRQEGQPPPTFYGGFDTESNTPTEYSKNTKRCLFCGALLLILLVVAGIIVVLLLYVFPTSSSSSTSFVRVSSSSSSSYSSASLAPSSMRGTPSPLSSSSSPALSPPSSSNSIVIDNTQPQRDVNGQIIDIHDGTILFLNNTFYWFGASYGLCNETQDLTVCPAVMGSCGFLPTHNISLFLSTDLVTWTPAPTNPVFQFARDVPTLYPSVLFCPRVLYNSVTGKWVFWYNYWLGGAFSDGYIGVSQSSSPNGPYEVVTTQLTTFTYSNQGDFDMWQDDNGVDAYVVYNSAANTYGVSVEKLAPDYLSTLGAEFNSGFIIYNREAVAMFKHNGVYFVAAGEGCCFCQWGGSVTVFSALCPLGTYTNPVPWTTSYAVYSSTPYPFTIVYPYIPAQQTDVLSFWDANGHPQHMWRGDRWGQAPDYIKGHDPTYLGMVPIDANNTVQPVTWTLAFNITIGPKPSNASTSVADTLFCLPTTTPLQITLNSKLQRDQNGNPVNAHAGGIYLFEGLYHMYGDVYAPSCSQTASSCDYPAIQCGYVNDTFAVYTTPDFIHWTLVSTSVYPAIGYGFQYFSPNAGFNIFTGLYYLVWEQYTLIATPYVPFAVSSTGPAGPFLPMAPVKMVGAVNVNGIGSTIGLFVDPVTGVGYIRYNTVSPERFIVEQLNSTWTGSTGQYTIVSNTTTSIDFEAGGMFYRNGTYYIMIGTDCCYCQWGASATYFTAPSPLGPWTQKINLNLCADGTQPQINLGYNPINPCDPSDWAGLRFTLPSQQFNAVQVDNDTILYFGEQFNSASDGFKSHDLQMLYPLEFVGADILPMTFIPTFTLG